MNARHKIAKEALSTARSLVELKTQLRTPDMRREVTKELHVKQYDDTEQRLRRTLTPFFRRQIQSARKNLTQLAGSRTVSDTAMNLAEMVFQPQEWDEELVNRAFPVLARAMGEAAKSQRIMLGVDNDKTTASEWLERNDEELPPGLRADLPPQLVDAIEVELREVFQQPYWQAVNQETANRIQTFLNTGLSEGWSISRMASEINAAFPMEYSRNRATLVARTESGDALNAGRRLSIDQLREDIPEVPIQILWLSVLSDTTREAHAALHDVPADADGLWDLNGVRIPWPSHWSLPAGDRCNCMCTILSEIA